MGEKCGDFLNAEGAKVTQRAQKEDKKCKRKKRGEEEQRRKKKKIERINVI